jgi:hypothetical protein
MEKKETKIIQVMSCASLKKLINSANEIGLTKEDIISLNKSEGEFILTYYK